MKKRIKFLCWMCFGLLACILIFTACNNSKQEEKVSENTEHIFEESTDIVEEHIEETTVAHTEKPSGKPTEEKPVKVEKEEESGVVKTDSNGLKFRLNDEKSAYIFVGCDSENVKKDIVIPNTFEGLPVTEIRDSSWYSVVPKTINSISLQNCLERIGKYAFAGCESLTEIKIPDSVVYIGKGAFRDCSSLKSVTLSSNIARIEEDTFDSCVSLESVLMPEGVTFIGDSAFHNCGIKSLILSKSLIEIEADAFAYCTQLKNVVFPNGIKKIGQRAFSKTSLESIVIPSSVEVIEYGCFDSQMKECIIGDGTLDETTSLSVSDDWLFVCAESVVVQRNNVELYASVSAIDEVPLKTLTVRGNNIRIRGGAFDDAENLETVILEANITEIGAWAFEGILSLDKLIISGNVQKIGYGAFEETGIKTVILSGTIEVMEKNVFTLHKYTDKFTTLTNIYCDYEYQPSGWENTWANEWKDHMNIYWKGEWTYENGVPTPCYKAN